MKLWHILENEDETLTHMKDKKVEFLGTFSHPQTFQPMGLYLVDYISVDGEMQQVKFAAPMVLSQEVKND